MEKIWYKSYDPGVPRTVDPDQYTSLIPLIENCFSQYAEKPCFVNYGQAISFRQVDKMSRAFAGFLQNKCNMVKGDRIVLMMPNCLQYPVAMFGALRAGLIIVNLNPWSKKQTIHDVLVNTQAKCILYCNFYSLEIEQAILDTPLEHTICTEIGDLFDFIKRIAANWLVKYVRKLAPHSSMKSSFCFLETLSPKYIKQYQKLDIMGKDVAFLLYTEGRRYGVERCVMISHRNMIANVLQTTSWLESFFHYTHQEAMINPFPLSKTLCIIGSLVMMRVGFATILITDPLNISDFVKEIKRTPFSVFYGINSLFMNLLRNKEFCHLDFSNLKYTGTGGMTVHRATAEKWKELTGCSIQQGFGLVETTAVALMPPLSSRSYSESLGLPIPSTEVKVCDNNGVALNVGEIGELYIKGPQVAVGYWNDPVMTKETFDQEGWLHTGDIVKMDDKGFIYLIDRLEDVMTKAGKKVYATQIEKVISSMPGVVETGVVGVCTGQNEHTIKAYIIRSDDSLDQNNVLEFLSNKLEPHEIPDQIEFTTILPHSIAGFLLRRVLREDAENQMKATNG